MRGGKREGAGRKPISADAKRVTFTCRVKPETKAMIDTLKANGKNIGTIIDRAIKREDTARAMQEFMKEYNKP